jgi:phospholipase C
MKNRVSKRIIVAASLVLVLTIFSSSSFDQRFVSGLSTAPAPKTPIQHIVFIIQENHGFDNMFGVYPGLPSSFALNLNACIPNNPPTATPCIKPWNADSKQSTIQGQDIPHTRNAALKDYNNGAMNGFVKTLPSSQKNYSMAYFTGKTLPYYWDYAEYFTLNYNFMSSALSYSWPNHLFTVAAQAGSLASTCNSCSAQYNLTFPQIGQSLTQAGITWGYYQYNWNDAIDCPSTPYTKTFITSNTHGGYDGLWSGLTDFTQVQMSSTECKSLLNMKDLQTAISSNSLPAVSWVIPEPQVSDHPGQSTWINGQTYVSSIINLIGHSPEWASTVIFLTWDDWGGYYDGVVPLQFDQAGQGFREPLIAISPYSRSGALVEAPAYNYGSQFKNSNQEDFSAFLSTIEYNWGLANLTDRDGYEPNLFYMLNFAQTPLQPLFLAGSGVTYPLSSCPTACTLSPLKVDHGSFTIYSPNVGINESVSQALNDSGNDDPAD